MRFLLLITFIAVGFGNYSLAATDGAEKNDPENNARPLQCLRLGDNGKTQTLSCTDFDMALKDTWAKGTAITGACLYNNELGGKMQRGNLVVTKIDKVTKKRTIEFKKAVDCDGGWSKVNVFTDSVNFLGPSLASAYEANKKDKNDASEFNAKHSDDFDPIKQTISTCFLLSTNGGAVSSGITCNATDGATNYCPPERKAITKANGFSAAAEKKWKGKWWIIYRSKNFKNASICKGGVEVIDLSKSSEDLLDSDDAIINTVTVTKSGTVHLPSSPVAASNTKLTKNEDTKSVKVDEICTQGADCTPRVVSCKTNGKWRSCLNQCANASTGKSSSCHDVGVSQWNWSNSDYGPGQTGYSAFGLGINHCFRTSETKDVPPFKGRSSTSPRSDKGKWYIVDAYDQNFLTNVWQNPKGTMNRVTASNCEEVKVTGSAAFEGSQQETILTSSSPTNTTLGKSIGSTATDSSILVKVSKGIMIAGGTDANEDGTTDDANAEVLGIGYTADGLGSLESGGLDKLSKRKVAGSIDGQLKLAVNGGAIINGNLEMPDTLASGKIQAGKLGIDGYNSSVAASTGALSLSGPTGVSVNAGSGSLSVAGKISASSTITSNSDARLKKNVIPIRAALEKVLNLRGVTYHYRTEQYPELNFGEERQLGFIAQEVKKQVPEVVSVDERGFLRLAYANLTALLVEAVKEINTKLEVFIVSQNEQQTTTELRLLKLEQENQQMRSQLDSILKQCKDR
ncbi:MAG: hypothetical protein RJB66_1404 [Pseudomonadota bacterium]|jgi:hypothetical protein